MLHRYAEPSSVPLLKDRLADDPPATLGCNFGPSLPATPPSATPYDRGAAAAAFPGAALVGMSPRGGPAQVAQIFTYGLAKDIDRD
jgi:hypothetical protein